MPLPLFALGALLTGGGIAKGLWDESEEKKKQRAMLDALIGTQKAYANDYFQKQREYSGDDADSADFMTNVIGIPQDAKAGLKQNMVNAAIDINPEFGWNMFQSMVPKDEPPLVLSDGAIAVDRRTGKPFAQNPKPEAQKQSRTLFGPNGDAVEVYPNTVTEQTYLDKGYVSAKPDKKDKADMTDAEKTEKELSYLARLQKDNPPDSQLGQFAARRTKELTTGNPKDRPMTQDQRASQRFHMRMDDAARGLEAYENELAGKKGIDVAGDKSGKARADALKDVLPNRAQLALPLSARGQTMSESTRRYMQQSEAWIQSFLRKDSGATITPSEFESTYAIYFPIAGDSPELIAAKARARKIAMDSVANDFAQPAGLTYNPQTGEFE
jgi:hypothetical protein